MNNDGQDDAGARPVGTTLPGGTILRVVEFSPGVQARNHRTNSIDYAIVMDGEIDMDMDGTMIHLKAGDVLVQRGTIHNWINNGTESCIIAVRADRRQAGDRRRQGAQRGRLSRQPANGTRWPTLGVKACLPVLALCPTRIERERQMGVAFAMDLRGIATLIRHP